MGQHDTGILCVVCKSGNVVAEIERKFVGDGPLIIGPGSTNQFQKVVSSYHCSNPDCQVMFHLPPGKPLATNEILAKESNEVPQSLFE